MSGFWKRHFQKQETIFRKDVKKLSDKKLKNEYGGNRVNLVTTNYEMAMATAVPFLAPSVLPFAPRRVKYSMRDRVLKEELGKRGYSVIKNGFSFEIKKLGKVV